MRLDNILKGCTTDLLFVAALKLSWIFFLPTLFLIKTFIYDAFLLFPVQQISLRGLFARRGEQLSPSQTLQRTQAYFFNMFNILN